MTVAPPPRSRPTLSERALFAVLRRIVVGDLTVRGTDGRERRFTGSVPEPRIHIDIRDPRAARRVLRGGGMALAEAYMEGGWDTPDLGALLDAGAANLGYLPDLGRLDPRRAVDRVLHAARANTRRGAKRNIAHHYDLGNDFYSLWLDDTMTYSCAAFDDDCRELEAAQRRKWDLMLERIDPRPGDHVLEIGCGWGGFSLHAAKEAGCRVTGLTISEEQRDWARERVASEGLDDRVDIRLQDYRDARGVFDHVVSIEMFEAVGERYWPAFFATVSDRLRDGGRAALQVITVPHERLDTYRGRPDFVQRYIFPGGTLPSVEAMTEVARDAGLVAESPRSFGSSYAETLGRWMERFEAGLPRVRELGFDERFERMWRYYLAYCRAGFTHGIIDVHQVSLTHA